MTKISSAPRRLYSMGLVTYSKEYSTEFHLLCLMSQNGRGVKAGNLNSEQRKDDTPLSVRGTAAQLNIIPEIYKRVQHCLLLAKLQLP